MKAFRSLLLSPLWTSFIALTAASCEPKIAYYPPKYDIQDLEQTWDTINSSLAQQVAGQSSSNMSVAIQISSPNSTLWSTYYSSQSNQSAFDGTKSFRIASNTKIFTALAILQLHAAGDIELDRSILKYLPQLSVQAGGGISWDKISIRSLLTHLAGIPDNYASEDILFLAGQALLDLPAVSNSTIATLPACEVDSNVTCNASGFLSYLQTAQPVFPPNTKASYSNVGYDLLGLVVANVTGYTYEQYVQNMILGPLNLTNTTFHTPPKSASIIPYGDSAYGQNLGVDNASGGLYSTADDMTKLLQYCLQYHKTISPTINWFEPQTYSTGSHSFLGLPWEIFRTTHIVKDLNRPITFVTKGGGLLGYYSYSVMIPDYELSLVILLAGNVGSVESLLDTITVPLVRDMEALVSKDLANTYTGIFGGTSETGANISLSIAQSTPRGLYLSSLIVNGNNITTPLQDFAASQGGTSAEETYYQIIPTFRNNTEQRDHQQMTREVWRMINVLDTSATSDADADLWNDYCVSNFDPVSYAGKPLNEISFLKDIHGNVMYVDLLAWNATLGRL